MIDQLARVRDVKVLLVLCLCWVGSNTGQDAFEPERIAQEMYSPLFAGNNCLFDWIAKRKL